MKEILKMTLKEFREVGVGLGFLNAEYGLAWQDVNHTITFNNINTKYNRKYFLAEPEKISWKYNKDTFEIEGLSKNELYKYMGVFTQGIKLVKNRIKCKKLDYDFTGIKFKPSKNRKKRRFY